VETGVRQQDQFMFVCGSEADERLLHLKADKRGWKINTTIIQPDEGTVENGAFPDHLLRAPTPIKEYYNRIAAETDDRIEVNFSFIGVLGGELWLHSGEKKFGRAQDKTGFWISDPLPSTPVLSLLH
jgi:hypothetical protein